MAEKSDYPARDLMYAIAKKARELANLKMPELREAAGYNCDTPHEAREMNKHYTRGELIEIIITEEFEHEAESIDNEFHD